MTLDQIKINKTIDHLIERSNLDERTQAIIRGRFGVDSFRQTTLQELGNRFKITRERVRQIESQAMTEIRDDIFSIEEINVIYGFLKKYIENVGGVRLDNYLISDFYNLMKSEDNLSTFGNRIHFVLKLIKYPILSENNEVYHNFWYDSDEAKTRMDRLHEDVISRITTSEEFNEILREIIKKHSINEHVAVSYLSVSKKIGVGPYGDIGLTEWEEINPKTVRAKAYLLLKKVGVPMHFSDIAKAIGSHAPTVHNELIKDDRFVLTGRGTYSLRK